MSLLYRQSVHARRDPSARQCLLSHLRQAPPQGGLTTAPILRLPRGRAKPCHRPSTLRPPPAPRCDTRRWDLEGEAGESDPRYDDNEAAPGSDGDEDTGPWLRVTPARMITAGDDADIAMAEPN
jgi:hypothetical protein